MRSSACPRTPGSSLRAAIIADRRVEGNLPSVPPFQLGITKQNYMPNESSPLSAFAVRSASSRDLGIASPRRHGVHGDSQSSKTATQNPHRRDAENAGLIPASGSVSNSLQAGCVRSHENA